MFKNFLIGTRFQKEFISSLSSIKFDQVNEFREKEVIFRNSVASWFEYSISTALVNHQLRDKIGKRSLTKEHSDSFRNTSFKVYFL